MKESARFVGTFVGASLLVGAGIGTAYASSATDREPVQDVSSALVETEQQDAGIATTKVANVQGAFSFDQNVTTGNEEIRQVFQKAVARMCASLPQYDLEDGFDWPISITGDDGSSQVTTLDKMEGEQGTTGKIMTCSCTANAAGGRSIVTAEVEGVSVEAVAVEAGE